MKTLISGNISINIRANHMARLYYKQEFNEELDIALGRILNYESENGSFWHRLFASGVTMGKVNALSDAIGAKENPADGGENEKLTDEKLKKLALEVGIDWNTMLDAMNVQLPKYNMRFPSFESMKVVWAMAKAEAKKQNADLPHFEKWLEGVAEFDINDCPDDFVEECEFGFFRYKKYEEKER